MVASRIPGQIVPLGEPLSELIGKVSPFPRIANGASGRRDRQHRSPMRPAINRYSKSGFGTVGMTCEVLFNHFGKLRRRLELLFAELHLRLHPCSEWKAANFRPLSGKCRSTADVSWASSISFVPAPVHCRPEDSRSLSENLLRQSDFVVITVGICHGRAFT